MPEPPGTDRALLALVREVFDELDPPPPEIITAAKASFTWLTVDAELADIAFDSLLDVSPGVRSTAGPRLVSFEAAALTVEVEIGETGGSRRLVGQLVPPSEAEIVVRHGNGEISAHADELGRFTVDGVPVGPVSLLVRGASATEIEGTVVTSWVSI